MEPVGGDPRVMEQALEFTRRGIPVIPVGVDKRPRSVATWKGRQKALPTLDQIRREFSNPNVVGYGVIMGHLAALQLRKGSCLFGLDFEVAVSYGRFLMESGLDQDALLVVESGGGGRHVWSLSGTDVGNAKLYDRESGEHIGDIKGEGGYLIGPESLHKSGRRYRWISQPKSVRYVADFWSWFTPIMERLGWTTELPNAATDDLHNGTDEEHEAGQTADLLAQECREGGRHDTLVKIVGYLRNTVDQSHALAIALLWNKDRCVPSLPPHEVIETVRDLYARYPDPPRLIVKTKGWPEEEEEVITQKPGPVPDVCWRGWVGEYRDIMGPTTEAPDVYHLGCALVAAGVVLGRSCWNYFGRRAFPNLFVILIGESGRTRKDTALSRAFLAMQPPDLRAPDWRGLDNVSSAEGLIQRLAADHTVMVHLSEISILLRNAQRESTATIVQTLTKLFDCPDVAEVATRKDPIRAELPFLSIIGATTPEWLSNDLTEEMIRGGFAGRFLYLAGEAKAPLDDPPPPDSGRLHLLRTRLHQIATNMKSRGGREGISIALSDDGKDWWREFYRRESEQKYLTPEFATLSARVPLHVRKVALLYAVLDGMEAITAEHLEAGAAVVRLSQDHVRVSHARWGATIDAKLAQRILELLAESGGAAYPSRVHQRLSGRVPAQTLKGVFQTLVMFKRVKVLPDGRVALADYERRNGKVDV